MFEIVHQESVKVYLHRHHVRREYSAEPSMRSILCHKGSSHLFPVSPTIFYRDANSVLLRAQLCTAQVIGSVRRTLCSKFFIKRAGRSIYLHMSCTTGMLSRNLYAQHPASQRRFSSPPGSRLQLFIAMQIQFSCTPLYRSRLYAQNPVFEIAHQESVKVC